MADLETVKTLAIALGLGLLVGLQRERAASRLAGIRTFPLITMLGAICGLLSQWLSGWIVAAGLVGTAALVVVGNLAKLKADETDPGLTTEFAILLMFGVGAYLALGEPGIAVALGGTVAILLHLKAPLHGLVARIGEADLRAIMRFALISLVILPVLPDRTYGAYDVLNPFEAWLMVVLIVGIGLAGYVANKLVGPRRGAVLGGLLGGLISSTATTVSHARRASEQPAAAPLAAFVVVVASAVSVGRVIVEVLVVAPGAAGLLAPPVAVLLAGMVLLSLVALAGAGDRQTRAVEQENPAGLRPAIVFGALYATIILAVAAAKAHLGEQGLYGVAVVSGLVDVDAVTLSTARLVSGGRLDGATGARVILLAALANLAFKGVVAGALGGRALALRVAPLFAAALAVGGLGLWLA